MSGRGKSNCKHTPCDLQEASVTKTKQKKKTSSVERIEKCGRGRIRSQAEQSLGDHYEDFGFDSEQNKEPL